MKPSFLHRLVWLGMAGCYLLLLIPAGLTGWFPILHGPPPTTDPFHDRWPAAFSFALPAIVLLALHWWSWKRLTPERLELKQVFLGALVMVLICVGLRPFLTNDIFRYLCEGRILGVQHLNPYLHPINEFPVDLFTISAPWIDMPSTYGPVLVILQAGFALVAGNNVTVALLLWKLFCGGIHLLNGWLLYRLLLRLGPEHAYSGLVFYLWNPLVLLEGVASGHNDILLATLTILAISAWYEVRQTWGIVCLALMFLTKFTSFIFLPYFAVLWWRKGSRRSLLIGMAIGGLMGLVCWLLFFTNPKALAGFAAQSKLVTRSVALYAYYLYSAIVPHPPEQNKAIAGVFSRISLVLLVMFILWRMHLVRDEASWLRELGLAGLFFLFVGTAWYQPWYVMPLIPIFLCVANTKIHNIIWWLGAGSIVSYTQLLWLEGFRYSSQALTLFDAFVVFAIPYALLGRYIWQHFHPTASRAESKSSEFSL